MRLNFQYFVKTTLLHKILDKLQVSVTFKISIWNNIEKHTNKAHCVQKCYIHDKLCKSKGWSLQNSLCHVFLEGSIGRVHRQVEYKKTSISFWEDFAALMEKLDFWLVGKSKRRHCWGSRGKLQDRLKSDRASLLFCWTPGREWHVGFNPSIMLLSTKNPVFFKWQKYKPSISINQSLQKHIMWFSRDLLLLPCVEKFTVKRLLRSLAWSGFSSQTNISWKRAGYFWSCSSNPRVLKPSANLQDRNIPIRSHEWI